ncbi:MULTISPECIES: recombinase family protein [Lysobacteraceae]|nr:MULTISPECIES: recombinase family protein [Lysobacter]
MSTEHQRYSTTNQRLEINRYAATHGMRVVVTYEDSGKSGLTLWGRPGLQAMLDDVLSMRRAFQAILVFDVSRWGRFQDVDESAYYEFVCRRAGVPVLYCAEPFADVPGPMAVVIKSVKRAMAAEYSRELGAKVFAGQSLLAGRGFHMGGFPSFGLKRVLVSETGEVKGELGRRQRKSIQTDRVLLALGDPLDCGLIRLIFYLFVERRMSEADIARQLNWGGYPSRTGMLPWRGEMIRSILRNERYTGTTLYARRSCSLKTPWHENPPERWVRAEDAFPAVVSRDTFEKARVNLEARQRHYWSDDELLDVVRRVHAKHGDVTPALMMKEPGAPQTTLFIFHFGSMADACEAAGVRPNAKQCSRRNIIHRRRTTKLLLLKELADHYANMGVGFYWHPQTRRACVEGGLTLSVRSTQAYRTTNGQPFWLISPDRRVAPDVSLVARLACEGDVILDYFVIPGDEMRTGYVNKEGGAVRTWVNPYRLQSMNDVMRRLEMLRLSHPPCMPRLMTHLSKRRRKAQGIRKRDEYTSKSL